MHDEEILVADDQNYTLCRVAEQSRSTLKNWWVKLSPVMRKAIRDSVILERNKDGEPTKARLRDPYDTTAGALFRRGLVWKRTIADTRNGVHVTWHLTPVAVLMLREFGK